MLNEDDVSNEIYNKIDSILENGDYDVMDIIPALALIMAECLAFAGDMNLTKKTLDFVLDKMIYLKEELYKSKGNA